MLNFPNPSTQTLTLQPQTQTPIENVPSFLTLLFVPLLPAPLLPVPFLHFTSYVNFP